MCYYDEIRWACGWKWIYFRQECKSQQLIHEMCDLEFIYETRTDPDVCGLCHDTEAKQRQYDKLFRDVQQWQREGGRSGMIEETSIQMHDLKQEIHWMKEDHERRLQSLRDEVDVSTVIPSTRSTVGYPIPLRDDTLQTRTASSNRKSTTKPLVSRPLIRSPSPRHFPMPGAIQTPLITSSSSGDHDQIATEVSPPTGSKSRGACQDTESSTSKPNAASVNANKACLICVRAWFILKRNSALISHPQSSATKTFELQWR